MFFSDEIIKRNKNDVAQITKFLDSYDVKYDFPEKTFVIRDKGEIIATGSVDGNILKYFFANSLISFILKTSIIHLLKLIGENTVL